MIIDEVATYLIENVESVELEKGTNLFKSYMPDEPNALVCLYDTGGAEPDIDIPTGSPTFQVMVRDSNTESAHDLIHEIAELLHRKFNVRLVEGGAYFYSILLLGEPGGIGRDNKNRDEYSANFVCKIQR